MNRDDASVRAMNALRRLVSALRSSGAAASAGLGMSVAQLFALRIIGQNPGLSMGDLATRTLTTPSAVSEVVARLVVRGLVRREPSHEDRRRAVLQVTAEGSALLDGMEESLPERLIAALAAMPTDARVTLANALEAWVTSAGLSGVTPSMLGEGQAPALREFAGAPLVYPAAIMSTEAVLEETRAIAR